MKIAIIGAGFTGLTAARQLLLKGHDVTIFEKDILPGGLAISYKEKEWKWPLEQHYHHWFTNDTAILGLAHSLNHPVLIKRPKTSVYVNNHIFQLDSPLHFLTFSELSILERIRMSAVLGILRFNPFWQPLEKVSSDSFLPKAMGERPYNLLWKPQLKNKFGEYADQISLAWFWARIKKRTSNLAYPQGGFLTFALALEEIIKQNKGNIFYNTEILSIIQKQSSVIVSYAHNKKTIEESFEKIIVTIPSFQFVKMAPQLPTDYMKKLLSLRGIGAINLILRLSEEFFQDQTYWLSICDLDSPLLAIVEHTHFMDSRFYNNEHIVYLGNYLPSTHAYFSMDEKKLLAIYHPFLKRINPHYEKTLIGARIFKAAFAQPIIPINYSALIPSMDTPLSGVLLANIQQVYPWDRGTNYAVSLGEKVSKKI